MAKSRRGSGRALAAFMGLLATSRWPGARSSLGSEEGIGVVGVLCFRRAVATAWALSCSLRRQDCGTEVAS